MNPWSRSGTPRTNPAPLGAAHGPPVYAPPAYGSAAYGPPSYGWAPLPHGSQGGAPAGPSVVWAVLLWVLAALSLIGALAFSGIATAGFFSNSYLDSYGVTTTATVTNVQVFTDTVTVEFTTDDGTPARAEIEWFAVGNVPAVGDEVEITYDPDDPWHATEAGSDSDAIMELSSSRRRSSHWRWWWARVSARYSCTDGGARRNARVLRGQPSRNDQALNLVGALEDCVILASRMYRSTR